MFGVRSTAVDEDEGSKQRRMCPLILPSNPVKRVWDWFFVLSILWVVCRWPFLVAFGHDTAVWLQVADLIAEVRIIVCMHVCALACARFSRRVLAQVMYFADIVSNFFSAYVDDGDLVTDHKAIAWHYVSTWFLIDIVLAVPYTFLFPNTAWPLVGALRFLHVDRLWDVESRALRYLELGTKAMSVFRLLKLAFYVFLAGHVSACIWYTMGTL